MKRLYFHMIFLVPLMLQASANFPDLHTIEDCENQLLKIRSNIKLCKKDIRLLKNTGSKKETIQPCEQQLDSLYNGYLCVDLMLNRLVRGEKSIEVNLRLINFKKEQPENDGCYD